MRTYLDRFPRSAGPLGLRGDPSDDAVDGAPAAVVAFDPV
jgi:hypothetical protein